MKDKNAMTKTRKNIIISLADNNMNISDTARDLYMHRNNVCYQIKRIYEITGMDPMNFYDLFDLVQMVKAGGNAEDGK